MKQPNMYTVHEQRSLVRIHDDYTYSLKDSYFVYESFLHQVGYSPSTIHAKLLRARNIHSDYMLLSGLQHHISKTGIIGAGYDKDGTAYLHFLCMIGLLDISSGDFFFTNPTTINKLTKWYEPYHEELGIDLFINTVSSVIDRTKRREVNKDKAIRKSLHTAICLVMRFHLNNIKDLTQEQWSTFLQEVKDLSSVSNIIIPNTIIGQALFELNILNNSATDHFRKFARKTYSFDSMPDILPVVELYTTYIESKYASTTVTRKLAALDTFFSFAKKKRRLKSLEDITRKLIYDYRVYCESSKHSLSYLQDKMYELKSFLNYVEINEFELKARGYKTLKKKVVVSKDFKVKTATTLPRSINEEIMDLLIKNLKDLNDDQFTLAFLLMLTTGICSADLMVLKNDCLRKMADDRFVMVVYRVKKHKVYKFKAREKTVQIVSELLNRNTQIVPTPHPDGHDAIFLINDSGHPLNGAWFKERFQDLRTIVADKNPELREEIISSTPHMLRHTFATRTRDNGASIYELADLLGHETINTTKKYTKESDRRKQEYIDRLNEKYVCDAIDDISKLTETEKGLAVISDMLDRHNNVGIGICTAGYRSCPMAYQCLECIYLCSTREDIPEMMDMLEGLKESYDELMNQGDKDAADYYKPKILRLIAKIKKLEEA